MPPGFVLLEDFACPNCGRVVHIASTANSTECGGEHQLGPQRSRAAMSRARHSDPSSIPDISFIVEDAMPKKKKTKKASVRSRRSAGERKVVVEERTRVIPSRRVVAVKAEPVTLARALGQAPVVRPAAEKPVATRTLIKKKTTVRRSAN